MLLRKKLRKAYVLSTVFRKPKEIILSTPSGNLHPNVLINLLSPPLMELLVVSLGLEWFNLQWWSCSDKQISTVNFSTQWTEVDSYYCLWTQGPDRDDFVHWLNNLHIDEEDNQMIVGDFNFFRSLSDRNRSGDNMNVVMIFNKVISNLGLLEIPLKGRKFTWSNMQDEHLLEQIDWVFTSVKWISEFPNTGSPYGQAYIWSYPL